jgi:hypothetical protein
MVEYPHTSEHQAVCEDTPLTELRVKYFSMMISAPIGKKTAMGQ